MCKIRNQSQVNQINFQKCNGIHITTYYILLIGRNAVITRANKFKYLANIIDIIYIYKNIYTYNIKH